MDRGRRYALVVSLVVVAVAAVTFAAVRGGDDDTVAAAGGDTSTTTTAVEPTSSTSSTTAEPTTTTSTTGAAPKATTTTTTATTTVGPRPGGGAAVHRCAQVDSLTANGLSAQVCQEGPSVAGSPTSLHITASDGDATVDNDCRSPDVEWGDQPTPRCMIACRMSDGPSKPSSIDITRDHTYSQPGTYHVAVTVESNCGSQPYGESHTLELDLVLRDPNAPPDGTG